MKLSNALDLYVEICLQAMEGLRLYNPRYLSEKSLGSRLKNLIAQILLLHIVMPHKINFTQMERYGTHTEKTYREAHRVKVDWIKFNLALMKRMYSPGERIAIAIDPSYIQKSGKHTPWVGTFWSGCAQAAKHGLEILGVAAINIDQHNSFSLYAEQTPNTETLEQSNKTLMDCYIDSLKLHQHTLLGVSKYVVADAAFSNKTFINQLLPMGFHLVSRFRDDIRLRYLYDGPDEKRRGPKKKYAGFIDKKHLDLTKMEKIHVEGVEGKLYTLIANVVSLQKNVRLVIWTTPDERVKIFFSTDLKMSGVDVVEYYKTRFQIEFIFRNCKEYTGLCDSQSRSIEKLRFAFNASLASENVIKIIRKETGQDLSTASIKSLMVNQFMLRKIISKSAVKPNPKLFQCFCDTLLDFELHAA